MDLYRFAAGDTPVLISMPHPGTHVPEDIAERMTPAALPLPDTDWHVDRLYDFAAGLGANMLVANVSRYVVDLNRDLGGTSLYPGVDNTEICPLLTFDREPIYRDGGAPSEAEIGARVEVYWQPYHDRIAATLAELKDRFGCAVLFDAHTIRSVVPRFFDGTLPDFNFGTASGASADRSLSDRLIAVLQAADGYSSVRDGRFTGGYITRQYGAPADGIHAVQLELSQRTYMNEAAPYEYRPDLAADLAPALRAFVEAMIDWAKVAAR